MHRSPTIPVVRPFCGTPPFCPNPQCGYHRKTKGWSFLKAGFYRRKTPPRRIQRYRCLHCGRHFSSQTFSCDYWLHRPELLLLFSMLNVSGAGLRQMARLALCAHSTARRHLDRAGKHSLLFHLAQIQRVTIQESVAADGFESFEFSQDFPCHFHLARGRDSWFLYYFTDSPLRRKGRMTPKQQKRRQLLEEQLGRPDPKAVETDMAELLLTLLQRVKPKHSLSLWTDEHPAYLRSVTRVRRKDRLGKTIQHHTISSRAARTSQNPLFAINALDLLLRHSNANHRRETIAQSKTRGQAAYRLAGTSLWINYIKPRWESRPRETPAMRLGLTRRILDWSEIFRQRLFPQRTPNLKGRWKQYYWGQIRTAAFGSKQRRPNYKYAF